MTKDILIVDDETDIQNLVGAILDPRQPKPNVKEKIIDGVPRRIEQQLRFARQPEIFDVVPSAFTGGDGCAQAPVGAVWAPKGCSGLVPSRLEG